LQSTLLYLPTSHEYLPMLHHFLLAPLPFSVAISDSVSSPTVSHCFDLNLKLETTPPWNKEVKMPARWFTKFNQLLRNLTHIFKEPRYQRETPSEYIIRKLKLIGLVHDYSISEVMQFIMEAIGRTTRFLDHMVQCAIHRCNHQITKCN
jgi:hypothetical protein